MSLVQIHNYDRTYDIQINNKQEHVCKHSIYTWIINKNVYMEYIHKIFNYVLIIRNLSVNGFGTVQFTSLSL